MTLMLGLDLAGRDVLVVGGGEVAARKVARLVEAGARVRIVALKVSGAVSALAESGVLTVETRAVEDDDVDGAFLVVAATDNDAVNARLCAAAERHATFAVNASDANVGSARFAARGEAGDVQIAVASTGTPDPVRAGRVRDALVDAVDAGEVDLRRNRPAAGRVVLVGAGPGDPDLMTVAARRHLRAADVVVADRLGTAGALALLSADVEVLDVGKLPGSHSATQQTINAILVERAQAGQYVVRLKGGDPFVFGRGGEEVHACQEAGIDVEVVPGVTSALSVPACAGIPVTQRGVSRSVLVTSGHAGAQPEAIHSIVEGATVAILMGVGTLGDTADNAIAAGADPDTPVAIIESGTTEHERVTYGSLASIARQAEEIGVKPPAVIVVGDVAQEGLLSSAVAATPREEVDGGPGT